MPRSISSICAAEPSAVSSSIAECNYQNAVQKDDEKRCARGSKEQFWTSILLESNIRHNDKTDGK